MKNLLFIAALFIVSGCAEIRQERFAEANNKINQKTQECYNNNMGSKSNVAVYNCVAPYARQQMVAAGFPYMDLYQLLLAERADLAIKRDAKKITREQAIIKDAEAVAKFNERVSARDMAAYQANAQSRANADAAMITTGLMLLTPTQPAYSPVNCRTEYRGGRSYTSCY